jgi:hypothetical protein
MNVSVLNTGGWILTHDVKMPPGTRVLDNVVQFLRVPFNPPGNGHLVFQVADILVNPSGEGPGFQFREVAIASDFTLTIQNADQPVA